MNVTDEQLDLLRILVGVYNGGCRSEFLFAQSFEGSALIYDDREQPSIETDAAVSDFERLASEDLLDVRYTERGTLRGKPTAKAVRLVASGGMKNATTDTARWTVEHKIKIALGYLRTKSVQCPLDGSSLKVAETTHDGGPPFSIDAYCPLCGNEMNSDSIYDKIRKRGTITRARAAEPYQDRSAPTAEGTREVPPAKTRVDGFIGRCKSHRVMAIVVVVGVIVIGIATFTESVDKLVTIVGKYVGTTGSPSATPTAPPMLKLWIDVRDGVVSNNRIINETVDWGTFHKSSQFRVDGHVWVTLHNDRWPGVQWFVQLPRVDGSYLLEATQSPGPRILELSAQSGSSDGD